MSAIAGITACLLGGLTHTLAPVPPEPPPDPMGRGYMGVSFQNGTAPGTPLSILTVEPNQPAARAGLQPNDILVRVGSLEPSTFEQVVSHICAYRPGAVVEIVVLRDGQRMTVKLKLGVRPPELDIPRSVPPFVEPE